MECSTTLPVSYRTTTNIAEVTTCVASTGVQTVSRSQVPICIDVTDNDDAVVYGGEPEVTPTPTPKPIPR